MRRKSWMAKKLKILIEYGLKANAWLKFSLTISENALDRPLLGATCPVASS